MLDRGDCLLLLRGVIMALAFAAAVLWLAFSLGLAWRVFWAVVSIGAGVGG